jgi:hypothetical protein
VSWQKVSDELQISGFAVPEEAQYSLCHKELLGKQWTFWENLMIYYSSLVRCSPAYHKGRGMTIWANYSP